PTAASGSVVGTIIMHLKLTTILLFAALFCGQIVSTQAQSAQAPTATPQLEQSFIQQWGEEIIFPSAVRFSLSIDLPPEQVTGATLTIKPESQSPITIPLDLGKSTLVGGSITEIAYIWQIPADNPPLLFKDIVFDWQVTNVS